MSSSQPHHDFDDELLSAYVDNELTAAERAVVEERLRTDEQARALVEQLRAASEAVKALPQRTLGRDLRGSILAELERRDAAPEAVPAAPALTLPERESDEQRPRGFRPVIYAAFAVAAALMVMALRGGDQGVNDRTIAQNSGKAEQSAEKKLEAPKLESAEPSGSPSVQSEDALAQTEAPAGSITGLSRSEGKMRSAAAPMAANKEGEIGRYSAQPQQEAEAVGAPATTLAASAPVDQSTVSPAAPASATADGAAGAAVLADAAPAALPAEAIRPPAAPVAEGIDDANRKQTLVREYEVIVADDASLETFEALLGEQQIAVTNDETPTELAAALPPLAMRRGGARDEFDAKAGAPAPTDAVLVEASTEQINALVQALRARQTAFRDVRELERPTVALDTVIAATGPSAAGPAARGGGMGGGGLAGGAPAGGFGGGGGRGVNMSRGARSRVADKAPSSRAWKLSLGVDRDDASAQAAADDRQRNMAAQPQAAAPAATAAPSGAERATSAGEAAAEDQTKSSPPVRVLFLLKRVAK